MNATTRFDFVSPINGKNYTLMPDAEFGFVRTHPWPEVEELRALYQSYDNPTPMFNEFRFLSLVQYRLGLAREPWRVCEIGCGTGELLKLFADAGHETIGFEPSAPDHHACRAKGLAVEHAFFEPIMLEDKPAQDLIILINLLEHVPDPRGFLERLRGVLADDTGYVLILVPNEFNPFQKLLMTERGGDPYFFGPPVHLSYFTTATIEAMVCAAGFDVVHRTTDFPMELFALQGRDYLSNPELGKACHRERVAFERRLIANPELFWKFYDALAGIDVGREIILVVKKIK